MELDRIELLQTSFNKLSENPEETALLFYARLFELHPEVRPMFVRPLPEQAQKFMRMLALIIGGMHRPATVIGEIKELGVRHVHYGTRPAHYEAVGTALLWAVEQKLGAGYTPEVKAAWRDSFYLIAGLMKEAAANA